MNDEPINWKDYFASLSDEKLNEFFTVIKAEVFKRNSNLTPTDSEIALANSGNKIPAIKNYRVRTGAGLAEAKKMIEDHMPAYKGYSHAKM